MAGYIRPLFGKISKFRKIIKFHGGWGGSFLKYWRTDELKIGELKGTDKFGNKYFENKEYFMGSSRWIEYSPIYGFDYDGSQIPAEWHGWMHYMTDETPVDAPPEKHPWLKEHVENFSGSQSAYYPYSTTHPKIESWQPPGK